MNDMEIFIAAHKKAYPDSNPMQMFTLLAERFSGKAMNDLASAFMVAIIFNHKFAKAFWGEKLTCLNLYAKEPPFADEMVHLPAFAYHLQKMVLEENPLKYLERFL